MPSFAARVVDGLFRLAMSGGMATPEKMVSHARRVIALVRPPPMLPAGISMRKTTLANEPAVPPGVPAVCFSSEQPSSTILYLHGGAFICGGIGTYAGLCGRVAKQLNARVFWIDYRLAPEMPYPAAPDDAYNAYCALAADYPREPLAIMGDSAGANLALVTLMRLRDTLATGAHEPSLRMAACGALMSPPVDLSGKTPSRIVNGNADAILTQQMIEHAATLYLDGHDAKDPRVSPILGELQDLPPLMVTVSDAETLRDDAYRLVNRARGAGVRVELLSRPDTLHAWPVLATVLPESRRDLEEILRFMRGHLGHSCAEVLPVRRLHAARAG